MEFAPCAPILSTRAQLLEHGYLKVGGPDGTRDTVKELILALSDWAHVLGIRTAFWFTR